MIKLDIVFRVCTYLGQYRRSPHLILFRLVSPKEIVTGSDMRTVKEERWTLKDFVYTSD